MPLVVRKLLRTSSKSAGVSVPSSPFPEKSTACSGEASGWCVGHDITESWRKAWESSPRRLDALSLFPRVPPFVYRVPSLFHSARVCSVCFWAISLWISSSFSLFLTSFPTLAHLHAGRNGGDMRRARHRCEPHFEGIPASSQGLRVKCLPRTAFISPQPPCLPRRKAFESATFHPFSGKTQFGMQLAVDVQIPQVLRDNTIPSLHQS